MSHCNSKFIFGTKAETLEQLSSFLSLSSVPCFHYFPIQEWEKNRQKVLGDIEFHFDSRKVIIRSSARGEDAAVCAMAGFYESVPGITINDRQLLSAAIENVISSYRKTSQSLDPQHQVLIQLMIENVSMSGVLFTQDLNTGAPYYVINYDDETGRTDTVTSGRQNSNRTLLVHRDYINDLRSERFKALLRAVKEIEQVTGMDSLDVEFALDQENHVYVFQVRPITTSIGWDRDVVAKNNDAVSRLKNFVRDVSFPKPGVQGGRTILGRMPDWNPAEMIGIAPRPLALSLYQRLITDYAWRQARKLMGYYEPPGARLMLSLCGQPYIDVRLSFNSFLPCDLDPQIAEKLVNAWIERLSEHKELHDKVEFEVAITAFTFDFDYLIEKQMPGVLNRQEKEKFRKSLCTLTDNLLSGRVASIESELDKIKLLEQRRNILIDACQHPDLTVVLGLLEDCIHLGTIPFSILARHAFIARSFLTSFVNCGVCSHEDILFFQKSIKTIASEVVEDFDFLSTGDMDENEFMKKYGHLRPGTYDILSKRYDQRDDLTGRSFKTPQLQKEKEPYSFTREQLEKIEQFLNREKFSIDAEELIVYIRQAILAREYAKFVFTKNISDALEVIAAWGGSVGLSRQELSYMRIEDILNIINVSQGKDLKRHLEDLIRYGRDLHEVTCALHLPYLIDIPEDVAIVPLLLHKPNFVTRKDVRGTCVFLSGRDEGISEIAGQIVLIENADPGFDWIFSRPIRGLITKYGGANSHMAIRCAEFGIPAAIGCGEQVFDRVLHSRVIELNCSQGFIVPLEGKEITCG